jgi:hypothetical protein
METFTFRSFAAYTFLILSNDTDPITVNSVRAAIAIQTLEI